MSQAAAAAALGEPESSSLLCVEGVGDEKQLILGKGFVSPCSPGAQPVCDPGKAQGHLQGQGSWQHSVDACFVTLALLFWKYSAGGGYFLTMRGTPLHSANAPEDITHSICTVRMGSV